MSTTTLQIGPYRLPNRLVLAPMAGVTDRPFRQLCRRLGAGLAVSEMVSANSALWGSRQTLRRMDHSGEPAPVSIQIAGAGSPRAYLASAALRTMLRRLDFEDVYLMSGIHAVAALAYGTESVERVAMIVAPGNAAVEAAKLVIARDVAVDLRGGPTELVILADQGADPAIVAADLLAALEQDPDAAGVVLATSDRLARKVDSRVKVSLRGLPKGHPAREALKRWSAILVCHSLEQAVETINRIAPARVQLLVNEPLRVADRIETAATVLMGPWTPAVLGDTVTGVAGVVPAAGFAAVLGPLGVPDFVRSTALVRIAAHHFPKLAATARASAELEDRPLAADALVTGERGER